jgi:hypothetical protein
MQFVGANGIHFAYRRWGKPSGKRLTPCLEPALHGNLDNWDRAVLDGFAQEREVIIFHNAGHQCRRRLKSQHCGRAQCVTKELQLV